MALFMTLSFCREIRPDELCSNMINIQKHEAVEIISFE